MKPPLLVKLRALPFGGISSSRAGAPALPPSRPNGGVTVRSQQTAAWACRSSTRHTRRPHTPPPPAPATPAAPGPCPAAVGHQRIFLDAQGKTHFDDLDRRVHHVGDGA